MKDVSRAAGLSLVYTNHCVRVTSIVNMKAGGAEDRKICAVSGHKNAASLQSYDRPGQKDMVALSKAIDKEADPPKPVPAPAATSPAASALSPVSALVSASGSSWSNVTINVVQPEKRKHRLSLKLKKKIKKEPMEE